jgi:hypothetical protein
MTLMKSPDLGSVDCQYPSHYTTRGHNQHAYLAGNDEWIRPSRSW